MPASFIKAGLFLLGIFFNAYIFILLLRLILVFISAEYVNPLVQFVVKVTKIPIHALRKFLPTIRRVETASLAWVFAIELLKFVLIGLLMGGTFSLLRLLFLAIGDGLEMFIYIFFYGIILQVILSWVNPYSEVNFLLQRLIAPVVRPFQRLIPPIANIDISPMAALIVLQLILIIAVQPITEMGLQF